MQYLTTLCVHPWKHYLRYRKLNLNGTTTRALQGQQSQENRVLMKTLLVRTRARTIDRPISPGCCALWDSFNTHTDRGACSQHQQKVKHGWPSINNLISLLLLNKSYTYDILGQVKWERVSPTGLGYRFQIVLIGYYHINFIQGGR